MFAQAGAAAVRSFRNSRAERTQHKCGTLAIHHIWAHPP
jgi:hypothetical protein